LVIIIIIIIIIISSSSSISIIGIADVVEIFQFLKVKS